MALALALALLVKTASERSESTRSDNLDAGSKSTLQNRQLKKASNGLSGT